MTGLWADFSTMAVDDPFKAIIVGIAMVMVLCLGLMLLKIALPSKVFRFRTIKKFILSICYGIGHFGLYLCELPHKLKVAKQLAKAERKAIKERLIEEAARKIVDEMPKVRVEIRTIDEYTYCYDCDIHFNKKLPECPNCFAKDLAEGDTKAIFGLLKGVREFRYLSFDREQDLIKFISEKMVGEPADGPEEKE